MLQNPPALYHQSDIRYFKSESWQDGFQSLNRCDWIIDANDKTTEQKSKIYKTINNNCMPKAVITPHLKEIPSSLIEESFSEPTIKHN